jgi:hypothetical protein
MKVLPDTLVFWTRNVNMLCASDDKASIKIADRKPDSAEPAAKPAVEIEEPEVQPGGNGD